MRCEGCNKFVSYEQLEPEVNGLEYRNGYVEGDVRIVLACGECGTELKEAELPLSVEVVIPPEVVVEEEGGTFHENPDYHAEVEELEVDYTSRQGPGRRGRMYYGAEVKLQVTWLDSDNKVVASATVEWDDEVQASSMDEIN